jgi:hypothetical protein
MLPASRVKQRFKFSRIGYDHKDVWSKKELGSIFLHKRGDKIDSRTLENCEFRIGDYIDISINYK